MMILITRSKNYIVFSMTLLPNIFTRRNCFVNKSLLQTYLESNAYKHTSVMLTVVIVMTDHQKAFGMQ